MDFQLLAGPRNVSVDLKYEVQCLPPVVVQISQNFKGKLP